VFTTALPQIIDGRRCRDRALAVYDWKVLAQKMAEAVLRHGGG
jgi:hypothetical protein